MIGPFRGGIYGEKQRTLIETGHPQLSIRRQCELLALSRSTYYY